MEFTALLQQLSQRAALVDAADGWPTESWAALCQSPAARWTIPPASGGEELPPEQLVENYSALAEGCLNTCFIYSQRNAAAVRIAASENVAAQRRWLPSLAQGTIFATVGLSHLTTSRQHLQAPAVAVRETGAEYVLSGVVPWVTGASQAQVIVTGGALPDGRQILAALPTDLPGVTVDPPAQLLALSASQTASVTLQDVRIRQADILFGPAEQVMKLASDGGGAGSLTTSALALGLSRRAIRGLSAEAARRDDLRDIAEQFEQEQQSLRDDVLRSADPAQGAAPGVAAAGLRQRANSLAVRASQAFMAVSKGAGFVKGHPAERTVREALFFLVWSCPQPVVRGNLEELTCRDEFLS